MIDIAPISYKNQSAFMAGSLWSGKSRLRAVSFEVTYKSSWVTCSHEQRVVRCSQFLAEQKHGRLVNRNWGCGVALTVTLAEKRIDLVGLWCCKRSARYGGVTIWKYLFTSIHGCIEKNRENYLGNNKVMSIYLSQKIPMQIFVQSIGTWHI